MKTHPFETFFSSILEINVL